MHKIDTVVVRGPHPRTLTSVADTDIVSVLDVHPVDANECRIHLCVAIYFISTITHISQSILFSICQNESIDRLAAAGPYRIRIVIVIRLVQQVCYLFGRTVNKTRRGPCTAIGTCVGRFDEKLNDGRVALRRYRRAIDTVACQIIAVKAVVNHRHRRIGRRIVARIYAALVNRHVDTIIKRNRVDCRRLIDNLGSNGNRIR